MRWLLSSGPVCLLLLSMPVPGQARSAEANNAPPRGETVVTRPRPELDPAGIRWESFLLYPEFEFSEIQDGNVFATKSDTESDRLSIYSPSLTISSDWNRHRFEAFIVGDLARYRDLSTEDYDDVQLGVSGLIEASRSVSADLGASWADLHESRDSLDDAGGLNPTLFRLENLYADLNYAPGRLSLSPRLVFREYDFDDGIAVQAGEPVKIDQDDRDREEREFELEIAWETAGKQTVFLRWRRLDNDYRRVQNFTGFDRSSNGEEAGIGVKLDLGGVTSGNLYYGFRDQEYEQPLVDIDTRVYEVGLTWNASLMTTVELGGVQSLVETTLFSYSASVSSKRYLRIDHEIRRNLLLFFEYGQTRDEYEGIGTTSRRDDTVDSSLGLKWTWNRYLRASFEYQRIDRDSSDNTIPAGFDDGDFENETVRLGLAISI